METQTMSNETQMNDDARRAVKRGPIRCFEGEAKPYEPFWLWVRNENGDTEKDSNPTLELYGIISQYSWLGDEITPKKFMEDLNNIGQGGPITIRINSSGGEIFAAHAIASMLADYPGKKTVIIDGVAASSAVMVALSGDRVKIHDTAYMMIHNPYWTLLLGFLDAGTLKEAASELDLFKKGMLEAYENRTGLTRGELSDMMDAETWMTARQAVELGFADKIISGGKKPARKEPNIENELKNFVNVPPALLNQSREDEPSAADEELKAQAQRLRERVARILKGDEHGPETL